MKKIKLKPGSPIIIPRVEIKGPKALWEVDLVFDTGAMYTCLSWEIMNEIGYDPARLPKSTPITTANGVIEVPLMKVKSIRINDLLIEDSWVICHNLPEGSGVDGLLGLSFLENFKSTINYEAKELIIESFH